jgi:hypothetical protein
LRWVKNVARLRTCTPSFNEATGATKPGAKERTGTGCDENILAIRVDDVRGKRLYVFGVELPTELGIKNSPLNQGLRGFSGSFFKPAAGCAAANRPGPSQTGKGLSTSLLSAFSEGTR